MRTLFIIAAGALILAAVAVELSSRLWPGSYVALLAVTFIALVVQGYLSLRLLGVQPGAQPGKAPMRSQTRSPARSPASKPSQSTKPEVESKPSGDRESGTVKWFNRTKGFGFIIRESGEEIFVHQRSIRSEGQGDNRRRPTLKDGQNVTFIVANRDKGLQAEDVTAA